MNDPLIEFRHPGLAYELRGSALAWERWSNRIQEFPKINSRRLLGEPKHKLIFRTDQTFSQRKHKRLIRSVDYGPETA